MCLTWTAHSAMEANPVGTASPPVHCRRVWQWWCRVRMSCYWQGPEPRVCFRCAERCAPRREPNPPGTEVPGRLSAGRAAAHNTPLTKRRILTCVPDTECGFRKQDCLCVAARVPSAASRAWLFRMGAGGQHPHTVLLFTCCLSGVAVPHGGGWSAPPHGFAFHL